MLAYSSQKQQFLSDQSLLTGEGAEPHYLYNLEAEQAIIGVLLQDNAYLEKVDLLNAGHFYDPMNAELFTKIQKISANGFSANKDTILAEMRGDKNDEQLHALIVHLANCYIASATAFNIEGIARLLHDLHLKRQLHSASRQTMTDTIERRDDEAEILINEAENRIFRIASSGDYKKSFVKFADLKQDAVQIIERHYKDKKSILGVPTGLSDLDKLMGGMQNSDLIIVAGRPSMGKTALAINMAVNACEVLSKTKQSVGFFSLEMSAEQLTNRILSMKTGINSFKLRSGMLTSDEFKNVMEVYGKEISQFELFIDDTAGLSINSIRSRARKLARRSNLGVLFIDYLQLLSGSSKRSEQNRVNEISEITQELKNIAKELNIPVVSLSQLSRAVEQRDDKRPLLSDLRESGSIEQDADVVMFIYRDEYYIRRSRPKENTLRHSEWQSEMNEALNQAEVIIAKQRNGPIGNVKLYYDSNTTVFKDFYQLT